MLGTITGVNGTTGIVASAVGESEATNELTKRMSVVPPGGDAFVASDLHISASQTIGNATYTFTLRITKTNGASVDGPSCTIDDPTGFTCTSTPATAAVVSPGDRLSILVTHTGQVPPLNVAFGWRLTPQ